MRAAALYDIHGNLPALEAVLEDVRGAKVDRIVAGGDIFPGPMAREVLALLRHLDIPAQFIRGNCETAVLAERAGRDTGLPEPVRDTIRWSAGQLDAEEERFLRAWPLTVTVEAGAAGEVLFCHATPRDDNEIFTSATAEERLAPVFADVAAPTVVCGHTHMQFDRLIGGVRVINAGSVGMPFGTPEACWLLLNGTERGRQAAIELRRTSYDRVEAARRIRDTAYPLREEFAGRYVLQTPSAEQMMELFARAELK